VLVHPELVDVSLTTGMLLIFALVVVGIGTSVGAGSAVAVNQKQSRGNTDAGRLLVILRADAHVLRHYALTEEVNACSTVAP
jgi:hypothetical protein